VCPPPHKGTIAIFAICCCEYGRQFDWIVKSHKSVLIRNILQIRQIQNPLLMVSQSKSTRANGGGGDGGGEFNSNGKIGDNCGFCNRFAHPFTGILGLESPINRLNSLAIRS